MPRFLDLFAGAGGLSEGFIRAGYEAVGHIEMDVAACYTLKTRMAYHWLREHEQLYIYNQYLNRDITREQFYSRIPQSVLNSVLNYEISTETLPTIFEKVDKLLGGKPLDLIIGGPPCQAYSVVGRARSETRMVGDQRNYLYRQYAEFLKRYQPTYFVFENVIGLLSAKDEDGTRHFDHMIELFRECGYSTEFLPLNASDYGVLQNRRRIILIGVKGKQEKFYPNILPVPNKYLLSEVFDDLLAIPAGGGTTEPVPTAHYGGRYLYESGIKEYDMEPVTFHQARPHIDRDLKIYRIIVDTWNRTGTRVSYLDLPPELRTHRNTSSFLDRFKVVAANLPFAQTIVAHIAKDGHYYIHPDITQNRSITPREAARIQTFPDNYYFESRQGVPSRTLAFQQIGNAVPVCLAYHIAVALLCRFEKK